MNSHVSPYASNYNSRNVTPYLGGLGPQLSVDNPLHSPASTIRGQLPPTIEEAGEAAEEEDTATATYDYLLFLFLFLSDINISYKNAL